jgi:PKD repeat protein
VSVTLVVTTSCVDIAGADFSVTPSTPQAGQAITLTGSVAHGTLPVTYTWDFGDGSSLTTGNPVTHTYGLSSTYRVVMTATNGCPSQDVASHDIFAAGEPNITVNPLSLSATLNPGDTATRTLTIGNVSTATANLNWGLAESPARTWLSEAPTAGTVPPSGSTGITVTFDATGLSPGVYTTTLRVTSDDQDEPQVDVSVALTVTTGCVPVDGANFDFAPANPSVGQMVVFTGTVTQGTEPITYTWNFDDGSGVQTGNPITHTFPLVDTVHAYTVTLNVTNICPSQQVVERTVVVRLRAIYLPIVLREY